MNLLLRLVFLLEGKKGRVSIRLGHSVFPDYNETFKNTCMLTVTVRIQPVISPVAGNCQAKQGYLLQLDEVLEHSIPKGKSLAGFFAESIQGVGGTVQYPRGYLKEAFAKVRELGGVCVSDEVRNNGC